MGFVTSDIDINQMQKADGWSDIVYGQKGNLSVWRANPGMIGSNLSVWRANPGMIGSNLSVWRASKGLSNITTVSGKTAWDGDALLLTDKGASASISPYGGMAIIMVTKEHQHRDCKQYLTVECGSYGSWVPDSTDTVTVPDGQAYTVTMNDKGYIGVKDKVKVGLGGLGGYAWSDWHYRLKVQLVSFVPSEGGNKNDGPGPGPSPGPTPTAPTSPIVFMPYIVGLGALAVVGGVVVVLLTKKKASVPASPKGGV